MRKCTTREFRPLGSDASDGPVINSPLALDGWLEFNRRKWGLTPEVLQLTSPGKKLPKITAIIYVDRKGRLRLPPRNPYLPMRIEMSDATAVSRLYRQNVEAMDLLGQELRRRGLSGAIGLDPTIHDVRPLTWRTFDVRPQYTFYIDFPHGEGSFDSSFRQRLRRAERDGFDVRVNAPLNDVYDCLVATEGRKRFSHTLTLDDLKMGLSLMGGQSFRSYVCYSREGTAASARIVLHHPGARAADWVAGTKTEFLKYGVAQKVLAFALNDLEQAGAQGFDHVGANIRGVAGAKADAGGRLVTYYTVEQRGIRSLGKHLRDIIVSVLGRDR